MADHKNDAQRYLEFLIAVEKGEVSDKWGPDIGRLQVENARLRVLLDESRKMQTIIQADGARYVEEVRLLRKLEDWVVKLCGWANFPATTPGLEILDELKRHREKSIG